MRTFRCLSSYPNQPFHHPTPPSLASPTPVIRPRTGDPSPPASGYKNPASHAQNKSEQATRSTLVQPDPGFTCLVSRFYRPFCLRPIRRVGHKTIRQCVAHISRFLLLLRSHSDHWFCHLSARYHRIMGNSLM